MEELSIAAETALSYLNDIKNATERLNASDNHAVREELGLEIIRGDLQLARAEVAEAEPKERRYLEGLCHYHEGVILWAIATGHRKFYSLGGEQAAKTDKFSADAAKAFESAFDSEPKPLYSHNLGLIYKTMGRVEEAIRAFEVVTRGDDRKLMIEARKEIGRIKHTLAAMRTPSPVALSPSGSGSGSTSNQPSEAVSQESAAQAASLIRTMEACKREGACVMCGRKLGLFEKGYVLEVSQPNFTGNMHTYCYDEGILNTLDRANIAYEVK